ncbi:MAG TPA: 3-phosphoshikimate 1-carboxyvinyltransferase [Desulfobacteria bacterium]|nr:3-phosphoshikimate 1-carboxyvinyltransferase [Desulfobacteria bacterium]
MDITIKPIKRLEGNLKVPGDKSISHRAVMFSALAEGSSEIHGFLPGQDCLSTIACFRQLGIDIEQLGPTALRVHGKGLHGLREPETILDVGNSGTTMRLMLGILAGQPFSTVLTGDASIVKRPMARVTAPLRQMGANIIGRKEGNLAPLAIRGGELKPINFVSPVASAQVKSAVLLAGMFAAGSTSVEEPFVSRDHTERMLQAFGARIERQGTKVTIQAEPRLTPLNINVPGDISSAAFLMVAASICQAGEVILSNVGLNPTRDGILEVLTAMGAKIKVENKREVSGELVGDLVVQAAKLTGISIGGSMIPRLIDEIPALAVAAAYAEGVTEIRDAAELKVKETNRITAISTELRKFGVDVEELPDGLRITGGKPLSGTVVESYNDHRIAMAMAVAALGAEGVSTITGGEIAEVSFPGFFEQLAGYSVEM